MRNKSTNNTDYTQHVCTLNMNTVSYMEGLQCNWFIEEGGDILLLVSVGGRQHQDIVLQGKK